MNFSTPSDQNHDPIKQAIALQRQGEFLQALNILQQVLAVDPNNFKALHGMGVLLGQMNRHEEALGFLTTATTFQPENFAVLIVETYFMSSNVMMTH